MVGWHIVHDEASAAAFVGRLQAQPISSSAGTSISGLIDYARRDFQNNGIAGTRRVIDISGDGPNSDGRLVTLARDSAVAEGITINGLPIQNGRPSPGGGTPATFLDLYYEDRVIGGPGAFILLAEFENFAPILLQKLMREITGSSFDLSQMKDKGAGDDGPACSTPAKVRTATWIPNSKSPRCPPTIGIPPWAPSSTT